MNNREMLQALLDGKKVSVVNRKMTSKYIHLVDDQIKNENNDNRYLPCCDGDEWEIHEEQMYFHEALEKMREEGYQEIYVEWSTEPINIKIAYKAFPELDVTICDKTHSGVDPLCFIKQNKKIFMVR